MPVQNNHKGHMAIVDLDQRGKGFRPTTNSRGHPGLDEIAERLNQHRLTSFYEILVIRQFDQAIASNHGG